MKARSRQLVIIASSLALICSCSKINLQGGKGGGQPGGINIISQPAGNSSYPQITGEWEIDYLYKGETRIGTGTISQEGETIVGQGADQDGREWQIESGQIKGNQVSFQKKYMSAGATPIVYTGELKYLESPEYKGWMMEGTYTHTDASGQQSTDKWLGNPTAPLADPAQQQAQVQAQPQPVAFQNPPPANNSTELGDIRPVDISGHYEVTYQYNFKKISSKMWLRNDGKKITGDGFDVVDKTSEKFTIPKGWYDYPKVTIVRQYKKGAGAKENRTVSFKATLSSNGRDIALKGETQYGGQWSARLVR